MDRRLIVSILVALFFLAIAALLITRLFPNNTVEIEYVAPSVISNVNS